MLWKDINKTKQKIIEGYRISYEEAMDLYLLPPEALFALADDLRTHFKSRRISTCMIMNAKSGACSENCKWCSQSAHHKTRIPIYKLVDPDRALQEAGIAQSWNVNRFSLVTSGRNISKRELDQLSCIYSHLREKTPRLGLCASLGLLSVSDLQQLATAGVTRYHCNIETAPSFFSQLCTTHTMEDKIQTIEAAREVGMEICSGGIIGMGESRAQRVEMAVLLQQLKADSIPVNILNPIPGTPLEETAPLTDEEILTAFAIFRIVNPEADIRFAGGRMQIKHIQEKALKCGISASLVGDMLTTVGSGIEEDFKMFKQLGYELERTLGVPVES